MFPNCYVNYMDVNKQVYMYKSHVLQFDHFHGMLPLDLYTGGGNISQKNSKNIS